MSVRSGSASSSDRACLSRSQAAGCLQTKDANLSAAALLQCQTLWRVRQVRGEVLRMGYWATREQGPQLFTLILRMPLQTDASWSAWPRTTTRRSERRMVDGGAVLVGLRRLGSTGSGFLVCNGVPLQTADLGPDFSYFGSGKPADA